MSRSDPPWDVVDFDSMQSCILCSSTTRSHALLLDYDDAHDRLRPTTSVEDATAPAAVCHTCYERVGGDAELVVREYESWLRDLCRENDVELRDLVETPGEVDVDEKPPKDHINRYADLPEFVVEALPTHVLADQSAKMIYYEYEERYLDVEFETRACDDCGESVEHQIKTDAYRGVETTECSNCHATSTREVADA